MASVRFGVQLIYRNGKLDNFDLVKNPPVKVVVHGWRYEKDNEDSIKERIEHQSITPEEFYELFLPSMEDRSISGVELFSPDGHRLYIDAHEVSNFILTPIRET